MKDRTKNLQVEQKSASISFKIRSKVNKSTIHM